MRVSLIAAVAENGVIGRANDLPWKLRDDMRFFVEKTRGHGVIMGRLNFDSMGKPLPQRRNIIVSRNPDFVTAGCETVTSVEEALRLLHATHEDEAYVIGGAQIYKLALPYAHTFYRTRVLAVVPGDVFFPPIVESEWEATVDRRQQKNDDNEHPFLIETLVRKEAPRSFLEET